MPEIPKSDEITLPPSGQVERRRFTRQIGDRMTRFVKGLQTNAAWMQKFLHGRK